MPLKTVAKRLAKRVAEGKNSITTFCAHLTFSTPWLLKIGGGKKIINHHLRNARVSECLMKK